VHQLPTVEKMAREGYFYVEAETVQHQSRSDAVLAQLIDCGNAHLNSGE
jgi:hypothetical protein